jgi:DNA polymerase I-like protein with 3'-5' exonuclease and polymerase domains
VTITEELEQLGPAFALDLETAMAPLCFQPGQARLIQFHSDKASLYYDLLEWGEDEWWELRAFLARGDLEIYGHNLAFDIRVLLANDVVVCGQLFDSMVASMLLHNGNAKVRHSLAEVSRRELGRKVDKSLQAGGGGSSWMEGELTPERLAYAMDDPELAWECCHVQHEKIAAQGLQDVYTLECALIPSVVSMEHHGIYLDPDAISDTVAYYAGQAEQARLAFLETLDSRLEEEGHPTLPRDEDGTFNTRASASGSIRLGTKRHAGFNLNSSQQVLAYWRFLGIEPVDDAKKPTTDKKVLARYQSDELVRLYLNYRRVEKRKGMAEKLCEHCDEDRRIRARFMPLATGTGRFASSSPNLQQVPRDAEFRCAFKAPAGRRLVQADYAAMELRVAAAIAKESSMIEAFNAGADIHTRTASLMFGVAERDVDRTQRQQSKAVNFGALYGSSARGVQQYFATLGMFISEKQARELLTLWHNAYPAFGRWHKQCQARALAGQPVRTVIGRRRLLYGEENRLTVQANNEVQGTSADIMKAALVAIHHQLPPKAFLIACVHDEVLVECEEADANAVAAMVLREMEEAAVPMLGKGIRVKAEGGVLSSWGDK